MIGASHRGPQHFMFQLISRTSKSMELESRLVAARVCGEEEWTVTANRYGASFWDHNNVVKLVETVIQTCEYTHDHWIIYFKMNFGTEICELHLKRKKPRCRAICRMWSTSIKHMCGAKYMNFLRKDSQGIEQCYLHILLSSIYLFVTCGLRCKIKSLDEFISKIF